MTETLQIPAPSAICDELENLLLADLHRPAVGVGEELDEASLSERYLFSLEMDQAVATVYGWSDLDLGHGFHETKQGMRYTISESARRTLLDRLLALNYQRYAEEVKAGLHDKGAKKGKGNKASATPSASLQNDLVE